MKLASKFKHPVLLYAMLINSVIGAFLFAVIPLLSRQLGFSDMQGGALLGLGSLGLLLAAPLAGYLAEKRGRRPFILWGLLAMSVSPLLFALLLYAAQEQYLGMAAIFMGLLLVRLLQSLFTGGLLPASQAMMVDTSSRQTRVTAMGMLGAAFGLGAILGAALLWWFAEWPKHWAFALLGVLASSSLVLSLRYLPETQPPPQKYQRLGRHIPWSSIWPCLLITLVGVLSFAALKQITGLKLQDSFAYESEQAMASTGLMLSLSAAAMVFAQLVLLRFINLKPWWLIALASILACLCLAVIFLSGNIVCFFAAMIVLGLAQGLLLPANLALLSLSAPSTVQAKLAGINALSQGLGMVLGPMLAVFLYSYNHSLPYQLLALLYLMLLLLSSIKLSLAPSVEVEHG